MTDPTFETREALETWAQESESYVSSLCWFRLERQSGDLEAQIARVRAAHAHLLEKKVHAILEAQNDQPDI